MQTFGQKLTYLPICILSGHPVWYWKISMYVRCSFTPPFWSISGPLKIGTSVHNQCNRLLDYLLFTHSVTCILKLIAYLGQDADSVNQPYHDVVSQNADLVMALWKNLRARVWTLFLEVITLYLFCVLRFTVHPICSRWFSLWTCILLGNEVIQLNENTERNNVGASSTFSKASEANRSQSQRWGDRSHPGYKSESNSVAKLTDLLMLVWQKYSTLMLDCLWGYVF